LLELGEKKFVLERDLKKSVFDIGGLHTGTRKWKNGAEGCSGARSSGAGYA